MQFKKEKIYTLVTTAFLVALKIVLERFLSYSVWNLRIGFSFIAVAFAAAFYGPVSAMVVAGLGDFLGAILFPSGQYFPGFTLTAILTALCTALFIHKNVNFAKITLSVLINQIFGSVLLNSLWISMLYSNNYIATLAARLYQAAFMTAIQIIVTQLLFGKNSKVRAVVTKQLCKMR